MRTITGIFKVDAEGNVVVPVGIEHAGEEVEVVVRPLAVPDGMTLEQWREAVRRTAGSIEDPTFRRHD
jgi:protein involved in polysaccharide export with SLBB domain